MRMNSLRSGSKFCWNASDDASYRRFLRFARNCFRQHILGSSDSRMLFDWNGSFHRFRARDRVAHQWMARVSSEIPTSIRRTPTQEGLAISWSALLSLAWLELCTVHHRPPLHLASARCGLLYSLPMPCVAGGRASRLLCCQRTCQPRRDDSNRNHTRLSVSSIQFSRMLVVAKSSCSLVVACS